MTLSSAKLSLIFLALAPFAYGQTGQAVKPQKPGILGYLDTKTGAFRPLQREAPDAIAVPNVANTTGKLVFTFTISIQSSIPTSTPITCSAIAEVAEISSTTGVEHSFQEQGYAAGTRSGSTATCTVNIPYSWALATPSNDSLDLSFYVTALSTTTPVAGRASNQSLYEIKVPANGVTTTEAVTAVL